MNFFDSYFKAPHHMVPREVQSQVQATANSLMEGKRRAQGKPLTHAHSGAFWKLIPTHGGAFWKLLIPSWGSLFPQSSPARLGSANRLQSGIPHPDQCFQTPPRTFGSVMQGTAKLPPTAQTVPEGWQTAAKRVGSQLQGQPGSLWDL